MLWCFSIFKCHGPGLTLGTFFCKRQNPGVFKLIVKSYRWRQTALAVAALIALYEPNAWALSLGRITVQSALGEPLRAEVDVPDINAEEAASLKISVASPAAFKAAGLDYSAALSNLQTTLHKRPDERSYIRVNGNQAINDPFMDMILEASWASGRIVRDYTLLFDPPSLRPSVAAAQNPAQISPPVSRAATPAPARPVAPAPTPARTVEPAAKAAPPLAERAAAAPTAASGANRVNVKVGDTASKIAGAIKPANVSLDQMLVALLRTNPMAFISNNVNRIKAGSVITVPSAEQAAATPATEAAQIIIAQSRDFNDFRRKLADNAPGTALAAAATSASGVVQAKVEDQRTGGAASDKLTLSKGVIQKQQAEDQLAKGRSTSEAATRAAELARNIQDLDKLGSASSTAPAPPQSATSTPSQAGAAAVAAKRPASVPAPRAEPGVIDKLMENPMVPAAGIGIVALLTLLGLYRARQRKTIPAPDSESLLPDVPLQQAESLIAASGGQQIDTYVPAESTGSAVDFTPSQLGTDNEVDPVAEADVYLAYGRDAQAEEILKEALRNNPERLAIHQKLLELFAKRRDLNAFEVIAEMAMNVSMGKGAEWERMRELGRSIDPGNILYRPNVQAGTDPLADESANRATPGPAAAVAPNAGAVDLDLDLDFSNSELPPDPDSETKINLAETAPGQLDRDPGHLRPDAPSPAPVAAPADEKNNVIEFSLPDLSAKTEAAPEPSAAPTPSSFGMLDFDLGSISLDLDGAPAPDGKQTPQGQADPLMTKLALAEEFHAIGDTDGARVLLEEVIAQASGDMKAKAQQALSRLS